MWEKTVLLIALICALGTTDCGKGLHGKNSANPSQNVSAHGLGQCEVCEALRTIHPEDLSGYAASSFFWSIISDKKLDLSVRRQALELGSQSPDEFFQSDMISLAGADPDLVREPSQVIILVEKRLLTPNRIDPKTAYWSSVINYLQTLEKVMNDPGRASSFKSDGEAWKVRSLASKIDDLRSYLRWPVQTSLN